MQTSRPAFVVSIHDVSPLTQERVAVILKDLAKAGLTTTSLLVIPNHHGKGAMHRDAGFCRWLKGLELGLELEKRGHEIVLHGYFHRREKIETGSAGRPQAAPTVGGLRGRLITECYTAGEGEFFDLSESEASARLGKGLEEFRSAGFHPKGFIAPAWLLGREAERAVKAAGFDYTTRLGSVKDLGTGRDFASQSLVWSVRAPWRRLVSLGWNASLAWRLRRNPLLRIGLHPPDWDHPAIRRQILRLIAAALAGREAMTYERWVARFRAS